MRILTHVLAPIVLLHAPLDSLLDSQPLNPSFPSSSNTRRGTKQTHTTGAQSRGTKSSWHYIPCARWMMELSRTLSVTEGCTEEAKEYNVGKDNPEDTSGGHG